MKLQEWEESSKLPKFKSYNDVPVGFEMVQGAYRSNPYELDETLNTAQEECAAALWNSTGMPLEGQWDSEIHKVNETQKNLGELTDQVRAVRCLIASYDMMHYNYTKAIANMLGAIKSCEYKHAAPIGGNIPWWPPNQSKRIELLEVYLTFLQAWEQKQKSLTVRTSKQYKNEVLRSIYVKLGEWSDLKRSYVLLVIEKLELYGSIYTIPETFWAPREKEQYDILAKKKLDMLIQPIEVHSKKPRNEDNFVKRIEQNKNPSWHHSFFDELDLWLDWIGEGKNVDFGSVLQKSNEQILSTCNNFTKGLAGFMNQVQAGSKNIESNSKIDKNVSQYLQGLEKMFGKPSREQIWLLAALWKTMSAQIKIQSEVTGFRKENKLDNDWLFKL